MNTRSIFLALLFLYLAKAGQAQPGLVVNEISQGTNGGKEYAELVVVGDPCTTVDLRGWIIDDNNGEFVACPGPNNGALSGCGIAFGHVRFSYDPIWQDVPVGTIILVYAYDPSDPNAQADIGGLTPDYTDSNCDWVRVVPINASNTHMERDVNIPHPPNPASCTCPNGGTGIPDYSPATYVPLNDQSFSGIGQLGMRNDGDAFQTRQPDGSFFHGLSYGSTGGSCNPPPFNGGPDAMHLSPSGSNMVYYFANVVNDDYRLIDNWGNLPATIGQTPGQPNTCQNAEWIGSLRRPPESYFQSPSGCQTPSGTPQTLCPGEQISFSLPANTASCSSDSYTWSITSGAPFVNIVSSSGTSVTIEGIAPGNATVTLTATIDNSSLYSQGNCTGPMFPQSLDYNFPVTVTSGPAASSTTAQVCDIGNGTANFDLTSLNNTVNQNTGLQVNWYADPNGNLPIGNPSNFNSTTATVYAQVIDPPCLSEIVPVSLIVMPVPSASPATLHGCDLGNGTAQFNLFTLNNIVNQGSGNNVNYWLDPAATMPITNPANYTSATTTIFANTNNGLCTSGSVPISLIVDPQLTPSNTFIQIAPTTACGSATVTVTFFFPSTTETYDISMLYGNSSSGFLTYNGSSLSNGSTATFNISETTDFLLTSAVPNSNPNCGVNFPNPNTLTATITPPPQLVLIDTALVCPGQSINLNNYVQDQNNSGINITFHTSTPPNAGNQIGPLVNPLSDTSYIAFANGGTGCQSQIEIPVLLSTMGTPQLDSASLCQNDPLFNLISLQDPLYSGTWSGPGVTDTLFNPTGQSGNVQLTFTPDDPCVATATTSIQVTPPLQPNLATASVCESDTLNLLSLQDSLFTGSWSGPGVVDTLFIAQGQSDSVLLVFTPDNSCYLSDSTYVFINTKPSFTNLNFNCDSSNQNYTLSFQITGGDSSSYTVNGQAVNGNTYISNPIPSGNSFNFTITDANNCGQTNLSGSFTCLCTTYAGSMNVAAGPLTLCFGQFFDLSPYYEQNANLEPDDALQYALHDNPGPSLGNLIALSANGFFPTPASLGLNTNQSYYVSVIAGNHIGNGQVDLNDPCLSVSQGIEISFYLPGLSANINPSICANQCADWNLSFAGSPPFLFSWSINGINNTINITQTDTTLNICPADYGIQSGNIQLIAQNLLDANCSNPALSDTFTLQVLPTATANLDTTLCQGQSISINGNTYDQSNPSGTELFPNAAASGCDSTLNINLSFYPQAVGFLDTTLCQGQSISINGNTYDQSNPSGTELFPNAAASGCDSTLNINLTFYPQAVGFLDTTLCQGQSISINGNTYDQSNPAGTELFPNAAASGCDSTLNINLSFYPQATGVYTDTLTSGDSLVIGGIVFDEQNPSGTVQFPGASEHGCDSTLQVDLTFVMLNVQLTYGNPLCYNSSDGYLLLEDVQGGKAPFWISLDAAPALPYDTLPVLFEHLPPGQHTIDITDADEIHLELEVTLSAPAPLLLTGPEVIEVYLGEDAFLNMQYNFAPDSIVWLPPDYLDDPQSPSPVALQPLQHITYEVRAFDANGCEVRAEVKVIVRSDIAVFIPNAFSPNDDGINDRFTVFAGPAVEEVEQLIIFDRWGNELFHLNNFPPNNPSLGWDGSYRGQSMNPGVYVYYAKLRLIDGSFMERKGDLVLIR